MRVYCLILIVLITFSGCKQKQQKEKHVCTILKTMKPKYAKGFKVDYYGEFKVVSLLDKYEKHKVRYVIYPKHKSCPIGFEKDISITDTINSVALLSTTQSAALKIIGKESLISCMANVHLVYDSNINALIQNGFIESLGYDYQPDFELIVKKKPDIVISDAEYSTQTAVFKKLSDNGIKEVICQDYKEQSPLARAEWIKFYGAIFNDEDRAEEYFTQVENSYLNAAKAAASQTKKQTVFCNIPYQGVWYLPTQANYTANLFADAGADYIWKDAPQNNSLNLSLNFEQVFQKAKSTEFWILFSAEKSRAELKQKDAKLENFDAYKSGKVYTAAKRVSSKGGIDYWESGGYHPDLILKDLIQIFNNKKPSNDSLVYFKKLNP
jgi:iron complex transport system substrate-binding protein